MMSRTLFLFAFLALLFASVVCDFDVPPRENVDLHFQNQFAVNSSGALLPSFMALLAALVALF